MNASELKQHFKLKIEEIKANPKLLSDKRWRLENLYVINTKSEGKKIFKLTRAQRHFLDNMRHRNIILKSRQLGFSTLITLWILDEILFSTNKEAIAIAHVKEGMTDIFDKKAKFAIMNFPEEIKNIFKFKTSSKTKLQIEFGDGSVSSFGVSLSGRSGTYHYVHISEYAKLSKQFPQRAEEVLTGTLPAVPFDGRVFIESTAEGACYSQDTEVLTDSGWKLFKDLKQDDKILSMDENNNAYYQKDWIFQKHWFDGNLISFKNQKVDLLVTPNHNLYVKTQKGKFKHRRADSLLESSTDLSFKKAFNWNGIKQDYFVLPEYTHKQGNGYRTKKEVAIPMNIWLEFLGYFFSEGCTNGNGSNIRQTVGKYQKEMFDCAKEVAGIIDANYHISEGTRITINSAQLASYLRKYEKPKTLPRFIMELDKEQLSIFFEAFYLGDGDIGKRNQSKTKDFGRIYTGIYDELTNDISEVALKLGYSVRTEKHKISNCRIVFFSDKKTGFYKTYKHKPQQVKYTGYVYCVTLPKDHIVLVRRNGKINWCGNSGSFYDMYYDALKNKNKGIEQLFNVEFYPHFYNWTWDDMELDRFAESIPVEMMEPNNDINWKSYQQTHGLTDREMTYYYMRWLSVKRDLDRLNQEYPTCLISDTMVDTVEGLKRIEDVVPDGVKIKKKFNQGIKDVYTLTTKNGYSITGTLDHKVKTTDGTFVELGDMIGKNVLLSSPEFGKEIQKVIYKPHNFLESTITVDKEFGRFLGYFMGDGSIDGVKGTISIACDNDCQDVVDDVEYLLTKYFGKPHKRLSGSKNGCLELRISSKDFIEPFFEMGIMRKNNSGNYKRKICVPDFVKTSPKEVVREFLIGLFEADGFADKNGNRIIFFTKYKKFAQDVQLLLLQFGITCKLNSIVKKAGNGNEYTGYELYLRKQEVIKFADELSFVSEKKNLRIKIDRPTTKNELEMKLEDTVVSIDFHGTEQVWDIETESHEFIANGIVVHNCIEEAFVSSGKPYFDIRKIVNCKAKVQTPEYYDIINYQVTRTNIGPLYIYKQPEKNGTYVVGADTAEGLSNGDYSTCTVINVETKDIVAIYQEHIPPDEFKDVVIAIGRYYNNALLAIESNKDGLWVNNEVERAGYANMYYRQRIDDVTKQVSKTFGWKTDRNTRDSMLTELRAVFTEKEFLVEPLLDEMQAFVRNSRGKPEAMSGKHDDLIVSTAIAYMAAKLWFSEGFTKKEESSKPKSHMDLIFKDY